MTDRELLAERFEETRPRLRAVAYRMLGSSTEAEDAVQEAWLRLSRSEANEIGNLGGWLTTVVARVCLDMLRSRRVRGEEPIEGVAATAADMDAVDPERDSLLAESISSALLVVLQTLAPAERVAFVLHDMFDLPFDEIGPIVDRSPAAARQLASRARRRVQGASAHGGRDRVRQREVVDAFLAASRSGDFAALVAVLDPDVVLRADASAVQAAAARQAQGAPALAPEVHGADAVATAFAGRAKAAQAALIDGAPGLAWAPGGHVRAAFCFTVADGRVTGIDIVTDPAELQQLDVVLQ